MARMPRLRDGRDEPARSRRRELLAPRRGRDGPSVDSSAGCDCCCDWSASCRPLFPPRRRRRRRRLLPKVASVQCVEREMRVSFDYRRACEGGQRPAQGAGGGDALRASNPVVGVVPHPIVVVAAEPVAPDMRARNGQSLTAPTAKALPGRDLNPHVRSDLDFFNRRKEVRVGRGYYDDVTLSPQCERHQVSRERDIHAFLVRRRLRPVGRVAEHSWAHLHSRARPRHRLAYVGGVPSYVSCAVGTPHVDANVAQLTIVVPVGNEFSHSPWPELAKLGRRRRVIEERAPGVPVEVLPVEQDGNPLDQGFLRVGASEAAR